VSKSTVLLSVCDFFCVEMIDAAIAEGVPVYIHESVSFPAGIYNVVDDETVPLAEYLGSRASQLASLNRFDSRRSWESGCSVMYGNTFHDP